MRNKRSVIAAILWLYFAFQECSAFSTSPSGHLRPSPSVTRTRAINPKRSKVVLSALNDTHNITPKSSSGKAIVQNRREWTKTLFSTLLVAGSASTIGNSNIQPVWAANGGDTVWKTGKSPEVPGQKPKDKGDVKGTKKDPSFLRSVSDCRVRIYIII